MTNATCPDRATLEKLLLGTLPAAERSACGEHLLTCQHCTAAADTLCGEDAVTQAIRARPVLHESDEEIIARVIERAKQLVGQASAASSDATQLDGPLADGTAESLRAEDLPDEISFLAASQRPDEIGRLGDYRVLRVLGIGGMGIVFCAEDPQLKRTVALKVMKPSSGLKQSAKERFLREAQSAASIEHDNIVPVYQVGEAGGIPYITMPLLRGESLKSRLLRLGRLPQRDVVRIGKEIAAGLAAAHEHGLIHRDIKPDNIWLEEKSDRAKILDFGLVRAATEDIGLTHSGVVVGTPQYMSPEQAEGQAVDPRCDLFSLGSVLFHLVAGRSPFDGGQLAKTLVAIVHHAPHDLDALAPDLHPQVKQLILRLMAKDRNQRPATAAEVEHLLAAIEQQLHSPAPESSTAPTHSRGGRKGITRGWRAAASAGASLILLGIVIVITNKDGSRSTVTLPDGVPFQVNPAPGATVSTTQMPAAANAPPAPAQTPPTSAPPEPLGTWEMGPEQTWYPQPYALKDAAVLPGVLDRPATLPGVQRWNVDTVWSRGYLHLMRWSPDGKWFATGGTDGHLRLYDAVTRHPRGLIPGRGHQYGLFDVAWSPDSDRLAVVSDDGAAFRIWSRQGALLLEHVAGLRGVGSYQSVAWSRDGQQIALGRDDRLVLHRPDGTLIKALGDVGCGRGSLAWSPDGQQLACWHTDGKVRLWNVADETAEILADDLGTIDGSYRLAWGSQDWIALTDTKNLRLYDPQRKLAQTVPFFGRDIAWHPDGQRVFFYEIPSNTMSVWDCTRKEMVGTLRYHRGAGPARQAPLDCSPDGRHIVSGWDMLHVCTSDLTSISFEMPQLYTDVRVDWRPQSQQLVTLVQGTAQSISFYSPQGTREKFPSVAAGDLSWLAHSPDGQTLACGGYSSTWLGPVTAPLAKLSIGETLSASWDKESTEIAVGTGRGKVVILDTRGNVVAEMVAGEQAAYPAWSPTSNALLVCCGTQLLLCEPATGWTLKPLLQLERVPNTPPVWRPDGTQFSIAGSGWYDADGRRLSDKPGLFPARWTADGKRYISPEFPGGLSLFLESGTAIAQKLSQAEFTNLALRGDGHLAATGMARSMFSVWTVPDMQPYWHTVMLPNGKTVTFSAAGEVLDGNPAEVDQFLVYYVEREPGKIENLTPAQFRELVAKANAATK